MLIQKYQTGVVWIWNSHLSEMTGEVSAFMDNVTTLSAPSLSGFSYGPSATRFTIPCWRHRKVNFKFRKLFTLTMNFLAGETGPIADFSGDSAIEPDAQPRFRWVPLVFLRFLFQLRKTQEVQVLAIGTETLISNFHPSGRKEKNTKTGQDKWQRNRDSSTDCEWDLWEYWRLPVALRALSWPGPELTTSTKCDFAQTGKNWKKFSNSQIGWWKSHKWDRVTLGKQWQWSGRFLSSRGQCDNRNQTWGICRFYWLHHYIPG